MIVVSPPSANEEPALSHDSSLEPILQAVEPALRLVHARYLHQILNFLIDRGRALPTNTDLPFWFTRADLAAADVLPREALRGTEPRLLLITDPHDRLITDRPRPEQLLIYWRELFRAEVMKSIDVKLAEGTLSAERCREQLNRFGPAAAREIRFVLESERLAAPEASDVDVFRTFAAVYLDLAHFTAQATEDFFPTLPHEGAVGAALAEDLPVKALFASSRPAGAADPERERPPDERWTAEKSLPPAVPAPDVAGGAARLLQRATEAEQNGNVVRAAILRTQAAAVPGPHGESARSGAREAMGQLVRRLGDVLEWDADTRAEWHQALEALLPRAATGIWPRAARCLYELQRIPANFSREVYAVEVVECVRTLGRRPVRRHLPHARPVLVLMAFRKAHKQLLRAGLSEREQLRVDQLLHHEMHRREHEIRHEFEPIIVSTLTTAGLVPTNRVEEVARDKLVAELLDRVCERGFLRIGDLRDAVARNRLKLADMRGPGEFVGGDTLLRADNGLAYALDGVYRRGEFYLRWIHRFVALLFGTPWGRALTLYLLLPFGGAFLTLVLAEELHHLGGMASEFISRSLGPKPAKQPTPPVAPVSTPGTPAQAPPPTAPVGDWQFDEEELEFYWDEPEPEPGRANFNERDLIFEWEDEARREEIANNLTKIFQSSASQQKPEEAAHHAPITVPWPAVLGLGTFFLLVFHVPPFRRVVLSVLSSLWRALRTVLWDWPLAVWMSPSVRAIRLSSTARFLRRHFATPVLLSLLCLAYAFLLGLNLRLLILYGWLVPVFLVGAYNTRPGWNMQDQIAEALSDWWRRIRVNFLPGLISAIIDDFRALANWVEGRFYAVDEWMRFRSGDSQGSLVTKAILGLLWFPIAYGARFVFYLLAEPQVNPVKHFPVVTVSHKVLAPLLLSMVPALADVVGKETAGTIYFFTQLLLPGVFGFLAWELKENWRLYSANRPPLFRPVRIGSHGETMRALLRPGFHSGTVPKIYRKARRALATGNPARSAVLHHDLEHAAEGVHRFAGRELVPLLVGCGDWGGVAVEVAEVRFGAQRAEIELAAPSLGRDPFVLAFENIGGLIEASVATPGWADKLTDSQRRVLVFALRGLLDMAVTAKFDGRTRTPDAPEEPGFSALVRQITWDEWVKRWGARSTVAPATAHA
jgi:hypothetical protein